MWQNRMEEVMKEFRMCCDPDVLRGNKFCFCCIPSCKYCRIVSEEEFELQMKMLEEQTKEEVKKLAETKSLIEDNLKQDLSEEDRKLFEAQLEFVKEQLKLLGIIDIDNERLQDK
jgi:hypothetical protein